MKLANLLKAIQFHGELTHVDLETDVQGIVEHSSASSKDMIYACLASIENAQSYIEDAIKKGVVVFLVSPDIGKLALKIKPDISLIISPLPRLTFAKIVSHFYAHSIDIVAVTGTNGKSSTVNFYRQIARALDVDAASLGTLGVFRDEKIHLPFANLTTLLPTDLHKTLALLSKDGVTHLALEASSHGLDQYRLHGIQLKAAAFTNFTQDHLDYHLTMENYFLAKMKVFEDILSPDGVAVLNADIPEYARIRKIVDDKNIKSLSYGKNGKDIKLLSTHRNGAKTELSLEVLGKVYETEIYIFGDFQVYNLLATLGLLIATNIGDVESVLKQFPHLKGADGRMELIGSTPKGGFVIVDFAHTPDALQNVLSSAKNGLEGKLWVVFGCGGNRDALKRPIMGSIASKYADHVIVTDDNPRFEEAHLIRQQVLEGAPNALEMGNRFDAISYAIEHLEKDDVLIIAGKGHETGQIIQDQVLPFNDAEVARSLIKRPCKMLWSSDEIQKITEGECSKTFDIKDVVTDHREITIGSLFVALKGETMDGHTFVEEAFKKGACGALVSNNYISNHDCLIKVENTYDAFIKIAEASRSRFKGKVLGITGSVGKTSVKEGLVFLLSKQAKTYGSKKSYNNHVGVPLTLINIPKDAEYVVLEMGMNHTGEMSALSLMAKPNGVLITTIAPAHLGNFESIEDIAHAKAEIFEGLTQNGFAILNEDNKYIPILKEKATHQNVQKIFTFGMKSGDAYILKIDDATIHACILGEEISFQLKCDGLHRIYNALSLLLFVRVLGLDLQKTAQDVKLLTPAPGRGEVFEVPFNQGHITVIDDSYNANPESMKSGLSTLKTKSGRKIAVLGDMRELGIQSKSYHLALLDNILDAGVDLVFLCGEFMFHLYNALPEVLKGAWVETSQDLTKPLQDFVQEGDVVLVKGSNSLKMNLVVNALKDLKRGA